MDRSASSLPDCYLTLITTRLNKNRVYCVILKDNELIIVYKVGYQLNSHDEVNNYLFSYAPIPTMAKIGPCVSVFSGNGMNS